jgi:GTP pyrophosphokinase
MDDFLEKVGWGVISIHNLTSRIIEEQQRRQRVREARPGLVPNLLPQRWRRPQPAATSPANVFCVAGTYDVYATPAACCNPKPGDDLIGYTTRGEGVKVHRRDCKNLINCDPERFIEVTYGAPVSESVPFEIVLEAVERAGLLNDVTNLMTARKANIIDLGIPYRDKVTCEVKIWLKTELANSDEAGLLMSQLLQIKHVFDAYLTNDKVLRKP